MVFEKENEFTINGSCFFVKTLSVKKNTAS